ncbi:MAG: hypothetical protein ABIO55_06665 [Ginsengibacter sp.]
MRKLFLITICFIITISAFTQNKKERREVNRKRINALVKQEEEGVIAYEKSTVFGAKLINDGYGIFFEMGRAKSVKNGVLFQLELSERKHPKEEKLSNLNNFYGTPFIFGKQNFFYPAKLGIQMQSLYGNKSNKNGVSITYNYGGGVSLGLLRPYYVQLTTTGDYVKFESADSTKFLSGSIGAGPGFGKGWSEIKVTPGLYAKTALRFDYGSYNEVISALEIGITGEYYTKAVPIMVHLEPKKFFFSGYVAIIFGKRK